jgi:ParB family transcriptional regulator, chromosome partitioning protein
MTTSAAEKVAGAGNPADKMSAGKQTVGTPAEKEKEKTGIRRALGRGLESLLPGPRVVARPVVVPPGGPVNAAAPGGDSGRVGGHQVPHTDVVRVRNEIALREGDIGSELRSDGQPGTAVPTPAADMAVAETASLRSGADEASAPTHDVVRDADGEPITIYAQAEGRVPPGNLVTNIALDDIEKNPYQTRYLFDKELLEELADSIRVNGVVQPVVVRPAEEQGKYILILGERRCRASKIAGKTTVPAIVKRVSEQQAAEMTVIENLQRQDLNCLEQAEAFRVLSQQFNLTQQMIGDRIGMSRESVSNYMRLLKLPKRVLEYLGNNQLGFSEARQLLTLDDPDTIAKAADEVVRKHMSIEQIEDLVIKMESLPVKTEKKGGARWVDPNVRAAQFELERMLGLRVRIRDRKGKGKIVIEYATVDDYERVVVKLKG